MRFYLVGTIAKQMEDFVNGKYAKDDTEILHIAKTDGITAYKELIAKQEEAIRAILDNPYRSIYDIAKLNNYSGYLLRNYQEMRVIEIEIEKRENS